jgi:S1-C subfamily serine protease
MVHLTGQMGVPVIVIDGQIIIGFDQPRLQQLLAAGSQRPRLGLKVADASKVARKSGAVPVSGAVIGSVSLSSPGERAGLRAGDIITEINMKRINNASDLEKSVTGLVAGNRMSIVFLRGEQTLRSEIAI